MKDTFLKLMFNILKNYIRFTKNDEEEKLHENDLPFLVQTIKIGKFEKHIDQLIYITKHLSYIRNLKQALDHGLVFKKVYKIIKFKQKS